MDKLKNLLAGMLLCAIPALTTGCSDKEENTSGGGDVPTATIEKLVPAETSVTFTVRTQHADAFEWSVYEAGAEGEMTRVEKTSDDLTKEGLESGKNYTVKVIAYKGTEASEPVKKNFTAVIGGVETTGYKKNILVHKFTATDCGYCPQMTAALKKAQEGLPDDQLIVMSMHCTLNSGISQFVTREATQLSAIKNVTGLPAAWVDEYLEASRDATAIKTVVKRTKQENPGVVGIDFSSAKEGSAITVNGTLAFVEDGNYKICCALLEDGLIYKNPNSVGGEGPDKSLYNHVLRDYADQTPVTGLSLGDISAEATEKFEYTIQVGSDWKTENCSVVVYVLKQNGNKYYITNANTAKVGEKAVSTPIQG